MKAAHAKTYYSLAVIELYRPKIKLNESLVNRISLKDKYTKYKRANP